MKFRSLLSILMLSFVIQSKGQNTQSMEYSFRNIYNNKDISAFHTPFKPGEMFPDSVIIQQFFPGKEDTESKSWFVRKLLFEHFISVYQKDVRISIDPVVLLQYGKQDVGMEKVYRNSRGFMVNGTLGDKIQFYSFFLENQSRLMDHVTNFANYYNSVPGQGEKKAFKTTDFDYAWSEGGFNFTANKHINISFYSGKTFIGNGYRSLLLSDFSFSYPQISVDFQMDKFRYITWFASFMNPDYYGANLDANIQWLKKTATFHYVCFNPKPYFEMGLFESNIWHNRDNYGKNHFKVGHINPLIFTNSISKKNNSVLGLNTTFKLKPVNLYGQLVANSNQIKNPGFQAGASFKLIGTRYSFRIFTEYNQAPPGTYSNADTVISYTHYNQSLAHPLGENFSELASGIYSRYRRLELEYTWINSTVSMNNYKFSEFNTHIPDYYLHEQNSNLLEGSTSKIINHHICLSYIINPLTNLKMVVGAMYRQEQSTGDNYKNKYFYVSLVSDLFNRYYDF